MGRLFHLTAEQLDTLHMLKLAVRTQQQHQRCQSQPSASPSLVQVRMMCQQELQALADRGLLAPSSVHALIVHLGLGILSPWYSRGLIDYSVVEHCVGIAIRYRERRFRMLSTVRQINEAVYSSSMGHGKYVYATDEQGQTFRVIRARTRK